jgi:Ca2+-binding RTX toxin-like protein
MNQAATFALLSGNVYWDIRDRPENRAPIPPGWKLLDQFTISNSGTNASFFGSGLSARVYQGPGGQIAISYAGTQAAGNTAGMVSDWVAGNMPIAAALPSDQANEAALLYQRVVAQFGAATPITFTGHSLGGGLAGLMAISFNRPAVVFDPAPFELAARIDGLPTTLGNLRGALRLRNITDPSFASYTPSRDFTAREAQVTSYAIDGEILQSHPVIGLAPRIEGSRLSKLIGTFGISPRDKHSIDLLAAVLLNSGFETALQAVPNTLPILVDPGLYGGDVLGAQQNLLVKLLRGEVGIFDEVSGAQITAPSALITKFTAELTQLKAPGGMSAQAPLQKALITAIADYYYYKDPASTTAFLSTTGGAIHFNYDDIGIAQLRNRSPALLQAAILATLSPEERSQLGNRLIVQSGWHIQAGGGAMNWTASAAAYDAALGGAGADNLNGGAGDDILIGGEGADTLQGGTGADLLLGGQGADQLNGGTGSDILLGGDGNDKYTFDASWGDDVIDDADGQGSLVVQGIDLNGDGAKKTALNTWLNADTKTRYTLAGTTLFIQIEGKTDTLTIKNWDGSSKSLGITLADTVAPPPAGTAYQGDFVKQLSGSTYSFLAGNYRNAGVLAGAADMIQGSNSADQMAGLKGNDALSGFDGADHIDGGEGDDLLLGGLGADTMLGGAGRDFIFGSGAGGLTLPLRSDFTPPVADGEEKTRGFAWVTYAKAGVDANGIKVYQVKGGDASTMTGDAGNTIDAGEGDDWVRAGSGADTVHGGAGDDDIDGLAGRDILFGDEGADRISGDGIHLDGYVETVTGPDQADDILDVDFELVAPPYLRGSLNTFVGHICRLEICTRLNGL